MVALLVVLTILALFAADYFLLRPGRQAEEAEGIPLPGPRPLSAAVTELPAGVFLQPTFTWSRIRPDGDLPWADHAVQRLSAALPVPIRLMDLRFDLRPYYAPERRQHHATLLLATLLRHLPEPAGKIVGVTCEDLFIPVLTFVFGQSQLDWPAAIVSTYRLHNEFYELPADEDALRARAVKEVVHELGHAFGLVHCRDQRCVMRASTYVEEVDLKDASFGAACRAMVEARS